MDKDGQTEERIMLMATHNERRLARAPHVPFEIMDFDVDSNGAFTTVKIKDRDRVLVLHVNKTEIIPEEQ